MKENYFYIIDTKKKAYWLGLLYAEAYMETRNQKPYRLGIEIGTKDEIIIDRFIKTLDLNPNIKHYRERDNTVIVKFVNKTIVKDLVKWGVVPRKSKIIELPNLSKRDLYLAFLLGFYDGDGKTGTTRIVSGSKIFLEQIKKHFNLPNKIYEKNSQSLVKNKLVISHGYSMSLGVKLFNEMLANYHNSLPRKRHKFKTEDSRIAKIKANAWRSSKKKLKVSKKELEELVWQLPLIKIGKKFGVSDKTIKKRCIKWGIATPPQGYWAKKRNAQKNKSNKEKEKSKSEEKPVKSEKEEKNENAEIQEEEREGVYEEINQKIPEEEKKEIEEFTRENEATDDSEEKKVDHLIKANKQEHPFVRKFNEVEEEEDFNDLYLWISPKVRENIEENKEKLLEKVSERRARYTDSLSAIESLNYFERGDLETEPKNSFINESSKEDLVENQPFINLEIGIEPVHYMQHQSDPLPDMEQYYIPEKPPEKPIDDPPEKPPEKPIDEPPEKPPEKPIDEPPEKPIEKPIDEPPEKPPEKPIDEPPEIPPEKPIDEPPEKPPEKPIDEPPEKPPEKPIDDPPEKPPEKPIDEPLEKPPEKPIDDPPEKPPEKPIDEPPEKPPEKPIDDPPEMPPEMPPTSIIGVGLPGEVGVSIISTIEVPQFADFSSSLESPTEEENFDDDIENVGNKESYEEENLDDDIENLDNIDEDNDFNENFDGTVLDDIESNENDDIYNSPDDPINYIDIGEYVPEAEADSSYGYSDCPDDCPSE